MLTIRTFLIAAIIHFPFVSFASEPTNEHYIKEFQSNFFANSTVLDYQIEAKKNVGNDVDPLWLTRFKAKVRVDENLYKEVYEKFDMNKHGLSGAMQLSFATGERVKKIVTVPDHIKSNLNLFDPKPKSNDVRFIEISTESGKIFEIYGKTNAKFFKGKVIVNFDIDGDELNEKNIGSRYNSFNSEEHGIIVKGSQKEKDFYNLIGKIGSSSYEQWEKCRDKAVSSLKQSEVGIMGIERQIQRKCGTAPVRETGTESGVGVEPRDLIRSQTWGPKFMKITKSHYKEFVKRFGLASTTVQENGWIIGQGQAVHSGGFDEAALAIKVSTGQVYGAMLVGGSEIYGFGFGDSWAEAPPSLQKWARENGLR